MLFTTKGIVLHTIKYGETSIITEIYTEIKGMTGFIVSGVRQPHAKLSAGSVQSLSLVELVAYDNPKGLCRVKEMRLQYVYHDIPFNVIKSGIGMFMAEIIKYTIREKEENAALFNFLYTQFIELDTVKKNYANTPIYFLFQLSRYLGFSPQSEGYSDGFVFNLTEGRFFDAQFCNADCLLPEESKIWHTMLGIAPDELKISAQERRMLIDGLLKYYKYHIENFPEINSLRILRELWS